MLFPANPLAQYQLNKTKSNTTKANIYKKQKDTITQNKHTRMRTNAQRDGRPVEYRWHPLFNAAKFG